MSRATRTDYLHSLKLASTTGSRYALSLSHLLMASLCALIFLYHNYVPIADQGVWGDVIYGEWILEHRTIPLEDPFVPLAEGGRIVDFNWLGQVVSAQALRFGGAEVLSHLYAVTVLATFLVLVVTFYQAAGRMGLAITGAFAVWLIDWNRWSSLQSGLLGGLCFAILLLMIGREDRRNDQKRFAEQRSASGNRFTHWLGVPLLFAVWANIDDSFLFGLAVVACCTLGAAIDVLGRTGSYSAVLRDRPMRQQLLRLELAVAATLLNPYGLDLWFHLSILPGSLNFLDLPGWQSLDLTSNTGIPVAVSWLILLIVFRHSRVRVTPGSVLLLAVFSLAVIFQNRLAAYFAPVLIFVLIPHLADTVDQICPSWLLGSMNFQAMRLQKRSIHYSLATGLIVWLVFSFSPVSQLVLGGKQRTPERLYSRATPLGITKYLREHPPQGQIINPQWWGDWLIHNGPADLQVFMSSGAVASTPPKVWNDYRSISQGRTGFEDKLDRYRVNTVVIHKELQTRLSVAIRGLPEWHVVYEDDLGLVAVRAGSIELPASEHRQ